MTPQEVTNIMDFIKNDPEAIKRTNSILADILPDRFAHWAGSTRNWRYMLPELWMQGNVEGWKKLGLGDNDFVKTMDDYTKNLSDENYKLICGGIAEATSKVIQDEIEAGNPFFKNLKDVRPDHRILEGTHHTATKFTDKNGSTFVLDYHQNLDIDNPMVYKSFEDWEKGIDGQTAEEYFKENPIIKNLKNNENVTKETTATNLLGENTQNRSTNNSSFRENALNEITNNIRENIQKLKNNIS